MMQLDQTKRYDDKIMARQALKLAEDSLYSEDSAVKSVTRSYFSKLDPKRCKEGSVFNLNGIKKSMGVADNSVIRNAMEYLRTEGAFDFCNSCDEYFMTKKGSKFVQSVVAIGKKAPAHPKRTEYAVA